LSFQANQGQLAGPVDFLARGPGYVLYLSAGSAVLGLKAPSAGDAAALDVLTMHLVGAAAAAAVGLDPLAGHSNYFIGDDPAAWHTGVPTYGRVEYDSVYPGINLVYYGNQRQLEYDFVLAPGADPAAIDLAFEGALGMALDPQGDLVLHIAGGDLVERAPVLYQQGGASVQPVAGRYVLEADGRVGFAVGAYDPTRPLVIDPVLNYSTYLGGNGLDIGTGIAVDAAGDAYVTGYTFSPNFPGTPVSGMAPSGTRSDIFVTKLNPAGTAVLYSALIGGTHPASGNAVNKAGAIAVDAAGDAYVTGITNTSDFPIANAWQPNYGGGTSDAFVAELNPSGTGLVYSSYLGGSGDDAARGITVDASGHAYVTGLTASTDFPTRNALQPGYGGGTPPLAYDAYVAEVNPGGGSLVYSTYLGGSGDDQGLAVAADAAGDAYVAGLTTSAGLATAGAWQPAYHPGGVKGNDGFVAELKAGGTALGYLTYLGGSGDDVANSIAVGSGGQVYVTGFTASADFQTTPGVVQPTYQGGGANGFDAFVVELTPQGNGAVYSTYLGGNGDDEAREIAVDAAGDAYVAGFTSSTNFPTVNALQTSNHGGPTGYDAFIARLNPSGTALLYSTYLGGTGDDQANGIAVDAKGNAYVVGQTGSSDFPTVDAAQSAFGGGTQPDAFVAKIGLGVLAANPDSYTTPENIPLIMPAPGVLANDTGVPGETLTAVLTSTPAHGQLVLMPDGSFVYTPATGYRGPDSFTYAAHEADGTSPPTTVSITVTGQPPVANPDHYSVAGGTTLVVNAAMGVLANDTDAEGDPLTAVLASGAAHGQVTLNSDGSFSYTPAAGYRGPDSFTYTAQDRDGASNAATVSIQVGLPPTPADDAYTATEGSVLSVSAAVGVLANDTDAEHDPLTAVLVSRPANGQLVLNADGSFTYTPAAGFTGQDTFTYADQDVDGTSAPAKVTITVVGLGPVANNDSYFGTVNTPLAVNAAVGVLANDIDGAGLTLQAVLAGGPAHGQVVLVPDGSFTYTPNPGFVGADTFSYIARDSLGNLSNPATVSLQIISTPVPVANPDSYAGTANMPLTVNAAAGVLANDTDAAGLPLTAVLKSGPAHGQVALMADGSLVYTPAGGFVGQDSFTYVAQDANAASTPATVTITVTATAPVANPDSYTGTGNMPLIVNAAAGVLANDTDAAGLPLTAVLKSGPAHGQVALMADGSFVYTPAEGFVGQDGFTYFAQDANAASTPATVTITIPSVPPVANGDSYLGTEDQQLSVNAAAGVLANDVDGAGLPLTAVQKSGPAHGQLVLMPDGSFTYTPVAGFIGQDNFIYVAQDPLGTTSQVAVVSIQVFPTSAQFHTPLAIRTGPYPVAVAVADFNGDGNLDLVTANSDGSVTILLGNGDGSFQTGLNYQLKEGPCAAVAVEDFNGDGYPDIAVTTVSQDSTTSRVIVLLGNGNGTFGESEDLAAGTDDLSLAVGRFYRDGNLDLAVADYASNTVTIYRGLGNGIFVTGISLMAGPSPRALAVGDFNGDGNIDLAVVNDVATGSVSVLLGNGDGTFEERKVSPTGGQFPDAVATGSFDGSGKLELAVVNNGSRTVSVLLNRGDGSFRFVVAGATDDNPAAVAVGDLNGDGNPDIVVTDENAKGTVSLLLGNGDATFQTPLSLSVGADPSAVGVGDFNGDRRLDLAVAQDQTQGTVDVLLQGAGTRVPPLPQSPPVTPFPVLPLQTANPFIITPTNSLLANSPENAGLEGPVKLVQTLAGGSQSQVASLSQGASGGVGIRTEELPAIANISEALVSRQEEMLPPAEDPVIGTDAATRLLFGVGSKRAFRSKGASLAPVFTPGAGEGSAAGSNSAGTARPEMDRVMIGLQGTPPGHRATRPRSEPGSDRRPIDREQALAAVDEVLRYQLAAATDVLTEMGQALAGTVRAMAPVVGLGRAALGILAGGDLPGADWLGHLRLPAGGDGGETDLVVWTPADPAGDALVLTALAGLWCQEVARKAGDRPTPPRVAR
jgi:hypothetical protein